MVLFKDNWSPKLRSQRFFATNSLGSSKNENNPIVFLRGIYYDGMKEFWFGQVLFLFHITCKNVSFSNEYAFIKYIICTPPNDDEDHILKCICLRLSTENCIDYKLDENQTFHGNSINVGENYGLVYFQFICPGTPG